MARIALMACLAVGFLLPAFAAQDQIRLKDGRTFNGQFISGTTRQVVFEDENGTRRRFEIRDVLSIAFEVDASSAFGSPSVGTASRQTANRAHGNAGRIDRAVVIPENSEIQVRVNEDVDSRTAAEGRSYAAQIQRDIVDQSGYLLIPRGSDAQLVIREVRDGGVATSPQLMLDLQSIRVAGHNYLVSTEDLQQSGRSGIGANRRTAEMVGGGAALGTLLGAIAGGGRGAAIGALAGAAAGGAVQVLTKGSEVRVPAETVLTFRLDQPLRLELAR
jgi:hypothetical protein